MNIARDRRQSSRLDKLFPVYLDHQSHIEIALARNVSAGGVFIETSKEYPLGSQVKVTFTFPGSTTELSMQAEVRYHYYFNYYNQKGEPAKMRGIGVKFLSFEIERISSSQHDEYSRPSH